MLSFYPKLPTKTYFFGHPIVNIENTNDCAAIILTQL